MYSSSGGRRAAYRFVLLALAGVLVVGGCDQTSSPSERQQREVGVEEPGPASRQRATSEASSAPSDTSSSALPFYVPTKARDCPQVDIMVKCYGASTEATSRGDLRAITAELRAEGSVGEADAVVVSFRPYGSNADVSGTGFSFNDEEAARAVLSTVLPRGVGVEEEARRAMGDDGLYVILPDAA